MQEFAAFLQEILKKIDSRVEVMDQDDHHLLIEVWSSKDLCLHGGVSERIIIPFLTRFALFTTRCELEEILTIIVTSLCSDRSYLISTRQRKRKKSFCLRISITAVQP